MPGVLLIVTDTKIEPATVERAIREAGQRESDLSVLSILDPTSAEKVAAKLLDTGQVGQRPSEGFLDSLHARHEQLAIRAADDVVAQARRTGVTARAIVRRGDLASEAGAALREVEPVAVVVERRRTSLKYAPLHAALEDLGRELDVDVLEI